MITQLMKLKIVRVEYRIIKLMKKKKKIIKVDLFYLSIYQFNQMLIHLLYLPQIILLQAQTHKIII